MIGFLAFWLGLVALLFITACAVLAHDHHIYYTLAVGR